MRLLKPILLAVLATSILGCSSMPLKSNQPVHVTSKYLTDSQSRLGLIAAFGQEADLLINSMKDKKEYIIQGRKFVTGTLEDKSIVITLSGISMTNAAMTTQMMVDHFNLKGIVFSGIAGSINPNLHVGDVVIAKSWIAPNEVYYANTKDLPSACGDAGDISCLGLKLDQNISAYGTQFFRQTNVITSTNHNSIALTTKIGNNNVPVAYGEMKTDFPVNAKMWQVAHQIQDSTQSNLEAICTNKTDCYKPKIVLGERGVSGGAFLANVDYRNYLHSQLKGDCVDMETASVAQVAYSNDIPFIAFRSLSDLAGADHDPNVGAFFGSGVAQRNAAQLTLAFIRQY